MVKPIIVYCTVPDAKTGKTIATALVKDGLCACVSQIPSVTSYYIYEGEFNEDQEELLIIKTDFSHFESLRNRITSLHPYTVPEIIAAEITAGNEVYLQWLGKALKPL